MTTLSISEVKELVEQLRTPWSKRTRPNPTIDALEKILNSSDEQKVQILSNGVVTPTNAELDAADAILSLIARLEGVRAELDEANLKIAQQHNKLEGARNEALEEAAKSFDQYTGNWGDVAPAIRALKTEPPMKIRFTDKWLKEKIETDGDGEP